MHWDEQQLNAHLHKSVQHLEALLGQPPFPLHSTQHENQLPAAETKGVNLPTDIHADISIDTPIPNELLKKRGISEDPENVDSTAK